jgi:hypothetical protein
MKYLKKVVLSSLLIFFSSCGTESQTGINPNNGFDMWEYMTSASNYEVTYTYYENNIAVDTYLEIHKQYGNEFDRISSTDTTTLYLNTNAILMQEPNNNTTIIRYLYLGDRNIFQSSPNNFCTLSRFYPTYKNRGHTFYNVIQVTCKSSNGIYQELYYGYNEGIVVIYEDNEGFISEYIKTDERAIF